MKLTTRTWSNFVIRVLAVFKKCGQTTSHFSKIGDKLHKKFIRHTMFSINKILLLALLYVASTSARISGEDSHRELSDYCDWYKDVNSRCCGTDLSECKCPVREYAGWGSGYIQGKWDSKCEKFVEKIAECDE